MATAETTDEGLSNLRKERWIEQQLVETSFAESAQETIIRQCGQCHDYGDTEGTGRTQNKSRWECQPNTETISFNDRRISVPKAFLWPVKYLYFSGSESCCLFCFLSHSCVKIGNRSSVITNKQTVDR